MSGRTCGLLANALEDGASMSQVIDLPTGPDAPLRIDTSSKSQSLSKETVRWISAALRLSLGWTFLWPFLDKMFGLGHETKSANAWIHGGSPTTGFLKGSTGPLAGMYKTFAGHAWADWGFMIGLLCIGSALLLGIGMRIAAISGATLLVLMWSAALPPDNNPFMDNHLIYALVLPGLALVGAGNTLGFGRAWAHTNLVRKLPWLT